MFKFQTRLCLTNEVEFGSEGCIDKELQPAKTKVIVRNFVHVKKFSPFRELLLIIFNEEKKYSVKIDLLASCAFQSVIRASNY